MLKSFWNEKLKFINEQRCARSTKNIKYVLYNRSLHRLGSEDLDIMKGSRVKGRNKEVEVRILVS
jgi:hypothetical protein